jgi:hypothetical protein
MVKFSRINSPLALAACGAFLVPEPFGTCFVLAAAIWWLCRKMESPRLTLLFSWGRAVRRHFGWLYAESNFGGMRPDPSATLRSEEFASLCEIGKGATPYAIPDDHRKWLIYLYYISDRGGRVELTEPGRMRLTTGR